MSRKAQFKPDVVERGYGFSVLPYAPPVRGEPGEVDAPCHHCLAVFTLRRREGKKSRWESFGVYRIEDARAMYESEEDFYEAIEAGRLNTTAGPFLLSVEANTMRLLTVDFTTDVDGLPTADAIKNWMHIERPPRPLSMPVPEPDGTLYRGGD